MAQYRRFPARELSRAHRVRSDSIDANKLNRWILPIAALLAFWIHHDVLSFSHLGHDSYPIIKSARVESFGDFLGTFSERLMDGYYDHKGHFYRPLLNASFAIDYAVWKLNPFGYHLTDLILLIIAAMLLGSLLARAPDPAVRAGALIAVVFFLFHPIHLNVLPVAPRRADMIALVFMLAALLATRLDGKRGLVMPAIFTLLAASGKETGAIMPVLIACWIWAENHTRGTSARPLRAAGLAILFAVPYFVVRALVVGGAGGHDEVTIATVVRNALRIFPEMQRGTFYPYPFFAQSVVPWMARIAIIVYVVLGIVAFAIRDSLLRRYFIACTVWFFAAWVIHAFSGSISPWYALHTMVPFALVFALLVVAAARAVISPGSVLVRAPAALFCAGMIALFVCYGKSAEPFTDHPQWPFVSDRTDRFLANLDEEIEGATSGDSFTVYELPYGAPRQPGTPIFVAAGLSDYTVQAYADILYPERNVRVTFPKPGVTGPAPDEILVFIRVEPKQ